jgi:photosystem II stability/assembly factor-like uncharacterized protein
MLPSRLCLAVVLVDALLHGADAQSSWRKVESQGVSAPQNWQAIASSADGTMLAAAVFGGKIYTSTDSGATWNVDA